jgi:ParB-like chromosome segregation protein Spo0J
VTTDIGTDNATGLPRLDVIDGDPVDHVRWIPADTLDPNAWNPNRVHRPELRLLERSILSTGWLQPILVNRDRLIIDGFHRWRLAQDSKPIRARWRGRVPVAALDVDRPTAMLMTVRINRAKGSHGAVSMASLVKELLTVHMVDPDQIAAEIGGTRAEVDLLAQDGVFAERDIPNWAYSPAWYPVDKV